MMKLSDRLRELADKLDQDFDGNLSDVCCELLRTVINVLLNNCEIKKG